eukprot:2829501-Rhodomonas_salina.1
MSAVSWPRLGHCWVGKVEDSSTCEKSIGKAAMVGKDMVWGGSAAVGVQEHSRAANDTRSVAVWRAGFVQTATLAAEIARDSSEMGDCTRFNGDAIGEGALFQPKGAAEREGGTALARPWHVRGRAPAAEGHAQPGYAGHAQWDVGIPSTDSANLSNKTQYTQKK